METSWKKCEVYYVNGTNGIMKEKIMFSPCFLLFWMIITFISTGIYLFSTHTTSESNQTKYLSLLRWKYRKKCLRTVLNFVVLNDSDHHCYLSFSFIAPIYSGTSRYETLYIRKFHYTKRSAEKFYALNTKNFSGYERYRAQKSLKFAP